MQQQPLGHTDIRMGGLTIKKADFTVIKHVT
jgi:hypothetical protein